MKKYFLFRKEEVTVTSVTASDTGVGLSLLAIPTDKVAYISSELGRVKVVFNDVTMYQEANLRDGESIEKSSVYISCKEGDELELVESILKFISSEKTVSNVMKFDVVTGKSTLSKAVVEGLEPHIKQRPINMQTGSTSTKETRDAESSDLIAGIDFGVNQPLVDYNHEGLSAYAHDAEVGAANSSKWVNAGSGGATYDIKANEGTPHVNDPASEQYGLHTKSVFFGSGEHLKPPAIDVDRDYTLYMVWDTHYGTNLYSEYLHTMYGDADGETLGPGGVFLTDGPVTKLSLHHSKIAIRHDDVNQAPAHADTLYRFPHHKDEPDFNSVHVLVIRRDKNNNIFLHDRDGEIIATLEDSKIHPTTGRLKIERIGTTNEVLTNHFHKSHMARFGVIDHDIGRNTATQLAQDLFNFYKF